MMVRGYTFFNVHANYKLSLFLFPDQLKFLFFFFDINLWQAVNQPVARRQTVRDIYENLPNDYLEKLYVILC